MNFWFSIPSTCYAVKTISAVFSGVYSVYEYFPLESFREMVWNKLSVFNYSNMYSFFNSILSCYEYFTIGIKFLKHVQLSFLRIE